MRCWGHGGGGTDTAPAHVAFGLISLANKPKTCRGTDSPRWEQRLLGAYLGLQSRQKGFGDRKAVGGRWKDEEGFTVE